MGEVAESKSPKDLLLGLAPLTEPEYEKHAGVYFFLSLDLVNSTAYKAENTNWKKLTKSFYDGAVNFWQDHEPPLKPTIWKYQGDEVLFYWKIISQEHLVEAVHASYRAVMDVSSQMYEQSKPAATRLHVKGMCWAAQASYLPPGEAEPDETANATQNQNLIVHLWDATLPEQKDFLGPEIDAGFRLSSGAVRNTLTVSAEVADIVLLAQQRERDASAVGEHSGANNTDATAAAPKFRVIDFAALKGVWNGRRYPIVWYRDWSAEALDRDFGYDGKYTNSLVEKAYERVDSEPKSLLTILEQVGKTWLRDGGLPRTAKFVEPEIIKVRSFPLEVHCVAVCFSGSDNVLVARRRAQKQVFPGKWEFGCARLKPGDGFSDAVVRDYEGDFGITADSFESVSEVIGGYQFVKDGHVVPGVFLMGRVKGQPTIACSKHAEAKWMSVSEAKLLSDEETVPNFHRTLADAHGKLAAQPTV